MKLIYTVPTEEMKKICEICRDGWPLYVYEDGSKGTHSLPEPVGQFKCFAIGQLELPMAAPESNN